MLDRVDSCLYGPLRAFAAVSVCRRLAPQGVGFFDECIDFLLSELRPVHIIRQRQYPAGYMHFDNICTVFHCPAYRLPDLLRSVRNPSSIPDSRPNKLER